MSSGTQPPDSISVALSRVGARDADAAEFAGALPTHGSIKRVATAVGEGSMAVRLGHERLASPVP